MASSAKSNSSEDLLAAVKGNDLDHVREILQSGVDPNISRGQGNWRNQVIPLLVAAENGQLEMIKCMLQFKADIQIVDRFGWTALHCAACDERSGVVELLISHGADVNKQSTNGGWTALHRACINGHETCVRILLENGANVALRDDGGKTARDLVWDVENSDIVTKLLDDCVRYEKRAESRIVAPLRSICDGVTGQLNDLKEKLGEFDAMKAELASLKAEMKQLQSASKAEVVQLSALKTEVSQPSASTAEVDQLSILKTKVDQLSASKADVDQLFSLKSAVEQHANDLSSLLEELFPKEDQPEPSQSIGAPRV